MKIHKRNTYQDGANRMVLDHAWHSSTPLDMVEVGDILRVKNKNTLEVVDWKVTQKQTLLSAEEAKIEWSKYPFGIEKKAASYGYFPYVLFNMELIKEYPPVKPSNRYIPSEVRVIVWYRDEGKCKRCGSQENLEFDHIIPVSKGGSNTENNIELLCKKCNLKKSDKII